MSRLVFLAADVRRVVEHSLAAATQRPFAYTKTPVEAPAVLLVHDQGIYLMSNGEPRDILDADPDLTPVKGKDRGQSFVAYAKGCNPKSDEDWWDTARDLVGGDDFGETLPWAQQIKDALDRGAKTITITFGKSRISIAA